ncbi:hypothetical protein BDQ94DRAFT_136948 [Aspergillus welwitschiae]|uniref:Uncharacterized protein n=1 Tax=Aspergillus welwitschiae TaxID=1341132 RepID=A0A3F3QCP8_9EURO|nr:hypothetical protein BDQ94DRAFT_136948 [Aspergillus welwitschiae]RDH36829.1 hypothetical protein BDQ94DRAFT_136948 [Aspergillus welwitschiae]
MKPPRLFIILAILLHILPSLSSFTSPSSLRTRTPSISSCLASLLSAVPAVLNNTLRSQSNPTSPYLSFHLTSYLTSPLTLYLTSPQLSSFPPPNFVYLPFSPHNFYFSSSSTPYYLLPFFLPLQSHPSS